MLFAGDYVSAADTAEAFERAGLTDHLWTYDTSKPPPTLRDMISAKRTLLVLSEHSGPPPSWYTTGYGIFQDTPYTFAAPADFNCDVNRGPADAPLFELNHFITNAKPPSAEEARQVNSAAALEARVQACKEQRGLSPTIIAVDFATVGDLIGVVDRLNDSWPRPPGPTDSTPHPNREPGAALWLRTGLPVREGSGESGPRHLGTVAA